MFKAVVIGILSLVLIAIVGVAATTIVFASGAFPGGSVVSQTRSAQGFDSIEVSAPGNLILSQGSQESVKVEAPGGQIDKIRTEVRNGTLYIESGWQGFAFDFGSWSNVNYYVTVKDLREISWSAAGRLTGSRITTDTLDVNLSGAGSVELDVKVSDLTARLSGAGSLKMSGTANRQDVSLSGVGSYSARELQSQVATVRVSGVGGADVNVAESLDAAISGVGGIHYLGNPTITQQTSGLGGVSRL
jgi:hypothetical protein